MTERILFLTGHLARPRLERVLAQIQRPDFEWAIVDIGVKVAALMTQAIIARRLPRPVEASRVVVPGRCRADLTELSSEFGVRFERGPDELKDLPVFLGGRARAADLSRHDMRIFAEIVDASKLSVDAIVARALGMAASGADVIDLGCLPDQRFPHLEDSVRAVKGVGLRVSVDSAETDELRRGARAGADFLLSLKQDSLDIAGEGSAIPVLIPSAHGRSRLAPALRGNRGATRNRLHPRSDPRSHPLRLRRLADALCRIAPTASASRDFDGHRQSDGVDRRGFGRRHRRAARRLLGAADTQRPRRARQPAYEAHHRGARRGAAHVVRRARGFEPAEGLQRRAAAIARPPAFSQLGR